MKFTRGKRIAFELLGPPALGALLVFIVFFVAIIIEKGPTKAAFHEIIQYAILIPIGAYMLAGIPSILSAAVIEWRYARGLDPTSWRNVRLCALLGFTSGASIAFVMGSDVVRDIRLGLILGGLGLLVGFLLGLLIKRWSTEKITTGENPP